VGFLVGLLPVLFCVAFVLVNKGRHFDGGGCAVSPGPEGHGAPCFSLGLRKRFLTP